MGSVEPGPMSAGLRLQQPLVGINLLAGTAIAAWLQHLAARWGNRIVSVRCTRTYRNKKKHRHRQNITITIVIDSTIIDADRFISPVELAG